MDAESLKLRLNGGTGAWWNVIYLESTDSTNTAARRAAEAGSGEGTVIVADTQTAGRGRMGRTWFSPPSKGVWLSALIRPRVRSEQLGIISISAAVAAVEGIRKATGIRAGIKWPNDLLLDGRKVCGILTESCIAGQSAGLVTVGVGVNVFQSMSDFPGELADRAISLQEYREEAILDRTMIAGAIIGEIGAYCIDCIPHEIRGNMDKWRQYCVMFGKTVEVTSGGGKAVRGVASDIDDEGALVVRTDDGSSIHVVSGEASVLYPIKKEVNCPGH